MGCIPIRYQLILMFTVACFISYLQRIDISILLLEIAEQEHTKNEGPMAECVRRRQTANETLSLDVNTTSAPLPSSSFSFIGKPEKVKWGKDIQAHIRGAYFYGYMVMNLLGGPIAENIGPRLTIGVGLGLSAILTALVPVCVNFGWIFVFIIRVVIGLGGGSLYPSIHVLISRWAPPNEKGKFIMGTMGNNLGTIIGFPLLGLLTFYTNWIVAILCSSLFVLGATVVFVTIVRNFPEDHPKISDEELKHIKEAIGSSVQRNKKKIAPYRRIIFSSPFIGLASLQFGGLWTLYFMITSMPQFLSDVMGLKAGSAGITTSLPFILKLLCGCAFGLFGDWFRKKAYWPLTMQRKFFVIFSHIIPGLIVFCMVLNECSLPLAVFILTVSFAITGASTVSHVMNPQDLAPNFAGSIQGLVNFVGSATGFLVSELVGYMTKQKSGYELLVAWHNIFLIGGSISICTGIIFLIFGSAEIQDYNYATEESQEEAKLKEDMK